MDTELNVSPISFEGRVADIARDRSMTNRSAPPGPPRRIEGYTVGAIPNIDGPGPRGVWHRLGSVEPSYLIHVTTGPNGGHRKRRVDRRPRQVTPEGLSACGCRLCIANASCCVVAAMPAQPTVLERIGRAVRVGDLGRDLDIADTIDPPHWPSGLPSARRNGSSRCVPLHDRANSKTVVDRTSLRRVLCCRAAKR